MNTAIGSETFAEIDAENFKALSKEDQERVLGIGVRQLWKVLHTASVHKNVECIELATAALEGAESPAAQFCLLAYVYRTGDMPKNPVSSEKDFLTGIAMSLYSLGKGGSEGCLRLRDEVMSRIQELGGSAEAAEECPPFCTCRKMRK